MQSKVILTYITITYNCEDVVEKTIESILEQKNDLIEYIIIDGASTDGTMSIVNRYKEKIDTIISEKDNGISDAFNKGIIGAKGKWIGIINAGDRLVCNTVPQVLASINEEYDVIYGNGIREYRNKKYKKWIASEEASSLCKGMSLVHPSVYVKKEAYLRYGLFDTSYKCVMDRELLLRFYRSNCKFHYVDSYWSIYSMGGISDKKYLSIVLREEMRINSKDGMRFWEKIYRYVKSVIVYILVKVRELMNFNRCFDIDQVIRGEEP